VTTQTARTVLAGVAAFACVAALGAAEPRRGAFGVGALRRDGVVIPFAAFDGKNWSSPWPSPAADVTVPINVRGVPSRWWGPTSALEAWQAWLDKPGTSALEARALRVVQPDWVDVYCRRQVGLRTDYRAERPLPPRTEQPFPKDGLVTSPPQPVDRIEITPVDSTDARGLIPALRGAFNDAERTLEQKFTHPISRSSREGVDPTIEAVYAFGDNPRVYYVEATRSYRKLPQQPGECTAIGFGTGWFVRDGTGVRMLTMAVDLVNCGDRYGASYMLPLGVMRLNDRLYWIAQFSGWDHERFVVLEITPKSVDVMVSAWGGSC
jgi:hypothetical protein